MQYPECSASDCDRESDLAIKSSTPRSKEGLVTTIYQFPEDAPKSAPTYCVRHGMEIAAGIARLSNPEGASDG